MKRLPIPLALGLAAFLAIAPSVAAANFPAQIDLPNGWQPEGITSTGTTFFSGSRTDGAVLAGNVRTGQTWSLVDGIPGHGAYGVEYEASAGRLWVAGGPTGTVTAYDARTGALLHEYTFPAGSVGFLNDVVATPDAIYVTDSLIRQLVVVPLADDGALPDAALLRPITGDLAYEPGFNANGIVAFDEQLIIVQSNTGKLFAAVGATGATREIDLGGQTVVNGDGLELLGSKLFVVRNLDNRIAVVKLGPDLATGTVLGEIANPGFDTPTTVTFAAGRLWAVNARFTTAPTPDTPYWVTRIP